MYRITCDSEILYDPRGVDAGYSVHSPKVKLEVNTVGEGSFTIYNNHPNYDKLAMMKSIIEVSDDSGVIFRGRMTENTMDFNHGLAVDIEGVMGFFNDSIVNPFKFPEDFQSNADYIAAKNSGNVVAFFLGWLIDRHNAQVQEFQRFKLGRVTVSDPNNYLYRYNEDWLSTWETIKTRLFESEIGGYLCIRYESDGNYIDYLSEFDETNSQEISFGENLLSMSNRTSSGGVFSAIIPIGAEVEKTITSTETSDDFEFGTSFETTTKIKYTVTIDDIADGVVKDDIYKSGKFLYSKSAVEKYGWICADPAESTFDDVTTTQQLLNKGIAMLTGEGIFMSNTIEVSALDLHFTDDQIQSFRIYKNINVKSDSHGISASYPLSKLDIDILNPQNTKITVGKTEKTLTDKTTSKVNSAVQKVEASAENLFKEVSGSQTDIKDLQKNKVEKDGVISSINQSAELIKILAEKINLVGAVTFSDLDSETQNKINSSGSGGSEAIIENWGHNGEETYIDGGKIYTGTVTADKIAAGAITTDSIASGAITSDKVAAKTLTANQIDVDTLFVDKIVSPNDTTIGIDLANGEIAAKTLRNSETNSHIQVGNDGTTSEGLFLYRDDVLRMMLSSQPHTNSLTGYRNWLLTRDSLWIQGGDDADGNTQRIEMHRYTDGIGEIGVYGDHRTLMKAKNTNTEIIVGGLTEDDFSKILFYTDGMERGKIDDTGYHGWIHAKDLQGAVAIANGGTGATDAGTALSNLGGLACKRWTQTATSGVDTPLCKIDVGTTLGSFLISIAYTVSNLSVSDIYLVSMVYGNINITKISDGGFVGTNARTIKAWTRVAAYGGNGGGAIFTLNPTLTSGNTTTIVRCTLLPMCDTVYFTKYDSGEISVPDGYTALASLNTVNRQNLVSANSTNSPTVIETGESGQWTYRKWSDHTYECWAKIIYDVDITTAFDGMYYGSINAVNLPVEFLTYPNCQYSVGSYAGYAVIVASGGAQATKTKTPSIKLMRPKSVTGVGVEIDWYVKGAVAT